MTKGLEQCDKCDYFISVEDAYKQGRADGRADAIDEYVKQAIKKQDSLFVNPSETDKMLFKCFLYVIAEQMKEQKEC